jgi:hypothetical protein
VSIFVAQKIKLKFFLFRRGQLTCIAGSIVGQNSFFSDSDSQKFCLTFLDSVSDSYSKNNILTRQWQVPLLVFIFVPEPVKQKRKFCYRKTYILFSFKCLTSDFSELFLFYSKIWIRPKPSDSFGLGSKTLIGQHPSQRK